MEAARLLPRVKTHAGSEDNDDSPWDLRQPPPPNRRAAWKTWCILGLVATALTTSIAAVVTAYQLHILRFQCIGTKEGFAEAMRSELASVIIQPNRDAWKDTTYTGKPSRESDLAWKLLQQVRGVWLTSEEARALNIEGLYGPGNTTATLLGVMHNLHCIRVVRQILYPEYYYPNRTRTKYDELLVHAGHCMEALRQSVMCHPDLTPRSVFWEDEERSNIAVNPSVRQTCVDWTSLVHWEEARAYDLDDLLEVNPAPE